LKLRLRALARRGKRKRRPRSEAPRSIVPPSANPFDAARERLKREIPPRSD
jgi:hypothetical protein